MTGERRITIIQGEQMAVSTPGTILSTLLGSCISVCLHDAVAHVGGMNHFLLGEPEDGRAVGGQDMQRYGVHAMELLINAMMSRGAARNRLRAHIYGGATVIASLGGIGRANAAFARRFVETEGIQIGHIDTGGTHARRVEFQPYEGRVRSTATVMSAAAMPVVAPPRATAPVGDLELF